jgi:iron complex outermembrane recepter protein
MRQSLVRKRQALLQRFLVSLLWLVMMLPARSQSAQITGVVTDPNNAMVPGAQVSLTNTETNTKSTNQTNAEGAYAFTSVQPGVYDLEVRANGFQVASRKGIRISGGEADVQNFGLLLEESKETVTVTAGSVENAYRVDTVQTGGPLGTTPIIDLPYTVNILSRQLIDDTQSRNFKEAAKYLPLISFQEMQGPEVLRPETRGFQGSNMQNDLKDGMGIAVTTPSAMEEYEQVEVVNGLAGPMYGPANPSGMFNFVTKRPTSEPFSEFELDYEGRTVATAHADLGGRFGPNGMFGYRVNGVLADGTGYVSDSQLRRQLGAVALDARLSSNTIIQANFSYYNLFQHGYPGWFAYTPSLTASKNILLPAQAPDPTREGYGQSFSGVNLTSEIGELRFKHTFNSHWQFVAGGLDQLSNRDIDTAVNSLIDNKGDYKTYFANTFQPTLAPRFRVYSNLGYLMGKFTTGKIAHDVVIGTSGYDFQSYNPVLPASNAGTAFAETAFCTSYTSPNAVCQANVSNPQIDLAPATGIPSYTQVGLYISSIIHQQGINLADTITLSPRWLLRVSANQAWTWTNNYTDGGATNDVRIAGKGNYVFQGISPAASLLFKLAPNMTVYGTFASSLQAPDVATAGSNINQPLPPYRSKEGEIGYKLNLRRLTFTTAMFRINRPFAWLNSADNLFSIVGNQVNYGAETMLSGRILPSLMVTGGLTVLNPKLTDTGIAATNDKQFVGIPDYKSNILAEYRLPVLTGTFFNFDWQHVGRRPIDDVNSTWTPQFNTFDFGLRYTTRLIGKITTWRITVNNITNVHYWSTLGPGSITGQSTGSYLGHLGEPRLITASMRFSL